MSSKCTCELKGNCDKMGDSKVRVLEALDIIDNYIIYIDPSEFIVRLKQVHFVPVTLLQKISIR